ncbi:MAG: esterase-like activity of phytase family protein [Xenococcaceae cyanobacterium]
MAQKRMFLNLSLEFLGEYQLPKITFKDTSVGGLSALTYDRQRNRFYALSDDRSKLAPARFYTLNLMLNENGSIEKVEVEDVTFLTDEEGKAYPQGTVDPEGIALSPKGTVFISSEGVPRRGIAPFIREFDLRTGQQQQSLRIPQRYLPNQTDQTEEEPRGVQENLGFEALTLNGNSLAVGDPFRLFTATESALLQDSMPSTPEEEARIRLMHYVIGSVGEPILVAEHLYLLDPASSDTLVNGLTELTALEKEGYFLSLERTFGFSGAGAKIFQVTTGNATDTSRIASLKGNLSQIEPLKKKLLLDLSELGIYLDNLEGMTLGPRLRDGSQSLVLLSDDNFREEQVTQFLLFRLVEDK